MKVYSYPSLSLGNTQDCRHYKSLCLYSHTRRNRYVGEHSACIQFTAPPAAGDVFVMGATTAYETENCELDKGDRRRQHVNCGTGLTPLGRNLRSEWMSSFVVNLL